MSFPASLCLSMNMEAKEIMSEMRREYGLKLYQTGKVTLSQAADFCEINVYEFISLLNFYAIPVINYSADELEDEFIDLSLKMR